MKISRLFIVLIFLAIASVGCQKEDSVGFRVLQVYIPNVIIFGSPDSNNIFYVQIITDDPTLEYTIELMEIFDRNGNPLFKVEQVPPDDPSNGWDGTFEGDRVESGTYSYSISISDGANTTLFVGDLTVLI